MGVHLAKGAGTLDFLRITGRLRVLVWLLLLALTAAIFAYPVDQELEYHMIQSAQALALLPLFATLYSAWLLVLLLLLFSGSRRGTSSWEGLALVSVFGLGFWGFWAFALGESRLGGDTSTNAAIARYITERGQIGDLDIGRLGYFNFPGMHLTTSFLSQVVGLDVLDGSRLMMLLHVLGVASVFYLVASRSLGNSFWGAFTAILMIQGYEYGRFIAVFYPGNYALILLGIFVFLLYRGSQEASQAVANRLAMVLILAATTVTHLVGSLVYFFILAVAAALMFGRTDKRWAATSLLGLALLLPITWEIYWAAPVFKDLAGLASKLADDIRESGDYATLIARANLGGRLPVWATGVQYFWLVVALGFGMFVGLARLLRLSILTQVDKAEIACLLGIILLTAVATLISPAGTQYYRFFMYAVLFTVPLGLKFVLGRNTAWRRVGLTFLVACVVVLSFPTFLVFHRNVTAYTYYADEDSASRFVSSIYGEGEGLTVYSDHFLQQGSVYYLLDANFHAENEPFTTKDQKGLWREVDRLTLWFRSEPREGSTLFLYDQERWAVTYDHFFAISPSDPHWTEFRSSLLTENLTYDNGRVQIYSH